ALVAALRERRPELFTSHATFYLSCLIDNALADGRADALAGLVAELAPLAGEGIDLGNRVIAQPAYPRPLELPIPPMRAGWPKVNESTDILPWGITEFADKGAAYETFAYLEHSPSPDPGDRALLDRLEYFLETVKTDNLSDYLDRLTGRSNRTWTPDDFTMKPRRKKSRGMWGEEDEEEEEPQDPGRHNLHNLTVEFLGRLHHDEGVSYTKGELARENL